MTTYYRTRDCKLQLSEATTARRQILVEIGTAEAKTVYLSKAGAAFTTSGVGATCTVVEDALALLTLATADLTTEGELAAKLVGATHTDYVFGVRVGYDDDFEDAHVARQAEVGKVVAELSDTSITVYDSNDTTALAKRIRSTSGTQTSWTPTTV
jgi:hypothetical protein